MSQRWWGNQGDHVAAEDCKQQAFSAGLKSAAWSGAVSTAVVLAAAKLSPAFNRKLRVSSKTVLIVMPPFFAFFLKSELVMHECARRRSLLRQAAR